MMKIVIKHEDNSEYIFNISEEMDIYDMGKEFAKMAYCMGYAYASIDRIFKKECEV